MCSDLIGHLPFFETNKILIKLIFHNILGPKENKMMGSFLETRNSVILYCSVSCISLLSVWNLVTVA